MGMTEFHFILTRIQGFKESCYQYLNGLNLGKIRALFVTISSSYLSAFWVFVDNVLYNFSM